jgi:ABC-type transporter Mla maintaining outer membrane lipid asymmetry ATPase subunit MlaF
VESTNKYDLEGVYGAQNFRSLGEGVKLRLLDGRVGEITGNPGDGAFVMLRIIESPDASQIGEEQYIYFADVKEAFE